MPSSPIVYTDILEQLKSEIREARVKAALVVNSELLSLYWKVGNTILAQQQGRGWGAKVIQTLSDDIRREFPDLQGFSCRNLLYMRQFASSYPLAEFTQQPVALMPRAHHVVLLDKVKDVQERIFYTRKCEFP